MLAHVYVCVCVCVTSSGIFSLLHDGLQNIEDSGPYFTKLYHAIGLMSRMFTKGPGDRGSIPGRVIPKTQTMVLDAACLTLSIIR